MILWIQKKKKISEGLFSVIFIVTLSSYESQNDKKPVSVQLQYGEYLSAVEQVCALGVLCRISFRSNHRKVFPGRSLFTSSIP